MKNGFSKAFLVMVLAVGLVSCGKEDNSNLTLDISKRTTLIPTSAPSCTQITAVLGTNDAPSNDVAEKYFSLRNPVIHWKHTQDSVRVDYIHLTLKSSQLVGGSFECLISGDELYNIFGRIVTTTNTQTSETKTVNVKWDGSLSPATVAPGGALVDSTRSTFESTVNRSPCQFIRCGGFQVIPEKDKPFEAVGTIEIFGVAVDVKTQEEYPVKSTDSFTVVNQL